MKSNLAFVLFVACTCVASMSVAAQGQQTGQANSASIDLPQPTGDHLQGQYADDLLKSGAIDRLAGAMKTSNTAAANAVGPAQILEAKISLPHSIDEMASDLRNGKFVTVSQNGPEVISLIRSLYSQPHDQQQQTLKKIQALASQRAPEAVNFIGVIFDYGLFGARRDPARAISYYKDAANRRYQPALFNLANSAFFGRGGDKDMHLASEYVRLAYQIGGETSYRVCGLASFLSYRSGKISDAVMYGRACLSPLANVANAAYTDGLSVDERVKMLRDSVATGADDGYPVLEQVTGKAPADGSYLFCKYHVLNQVRLQSGHADVARLVDSCYAANTKAYGSPDEIAKRGQIVSGINSFVPYELQSLQNLRAGNHFHYSWTVPYLPFRQDEADLFALLINKDKS